MSQEEKRWETYYQNMPQSENADVFQELLATPTPITSVLDIGCGYGDLVCLFARQGIKGVGIDIAHSPLQRAREKLTDAEKKLLTFLKADFHTLALEDHDMTHKFDLVNNFMGPSLRDEKDYQKFIRASKKYCRIGICVEGENSLIKKLVAKKIIPPLPREDSERKAIYQYLLKTPCNYQSQKITSTTTWEAPLPFWQKYLANITHQEISLEGAKELTKHVQDAKIKSTTTITYELITIEVNTTK